MEKTSIILVTKNSKTLQSCIGTIEGNTKAPYDLIIVNSGKLIPQEEYYKVINVPGATMVEQFSIGIRAIHTEFFTRFPDDHYVQPNWLTCAHATYLTSFPDGYGVVTMNDNIDHGSKLSVPLLKKAFVIKYLNGTFEDTRFYHFRAAVEVMERIKATGKLAYCEEAKIIHRHKRIPEHYEHWKHDYEEYQLLKRQRRKSKCESLSA